MYKSMRFGSLVVSFSDRASDIKTLPLDDGTDGFRFETPRGQKGLVRFTEKYLEKPSNRICGGGIMGGLKGFGARLYFELPTSARKLYAFAGK